MEKQEICELKQEKKNVLHISWCVVDSLNQHNTDLLACLWNDLYTVISLQKEKGPRAPPVESCVLWDPG